MDKITRFREANPNKKIHTIDSSDFKKFGEIKTGYDISDISEYFSNSVKIKEKNLYTTSNSEIENFDVVKQLSNDIYPGVETQAGECTGHSKDFSAVEYHQGSETNIFFTDVIMVLAKRSQMTNNNINIQESGEIYFVPKGTVIEFYSDTLHYAPIQVTDEGIKILVMLIKGTNEELPNNFKSSNRIITKINKFQVVHKSRKDKINNGAVIGVTGELLTFNMIN
ncbi:DUF4867 family protein [Companilactobacillus sp. DQM5]|uniref:DUF4867 family protein n=1 Tax=Companilactobacillus sp. DQM5 TaxID=3463359 RepID=UPI004057DE4C